MKETWTYAVVFASLPVIWWIAQAASGLPPSILPPPGLVATLLWEERASLLAHTGQTLRIALFGYALSNLLALALSISFLYLKSIENFATSWAVVIKNIPYVTIASVLVVTMGDTMAPKLIIVILVTFFPLLANLKKGLKATEPVLLDRLRTLHASRWQIFRKAQWPTALPYYMAAHEIAFTSAIVGAIVAEWFFSSEGLGYLIVQSTTEYRLYAVTFIASALSVGAYIAIRVADRRLFHWKQELEEV